MPLKERSTSESRWFTELPWDTDFFGIRVARVKSDLNVSPHEILSTMRGGGIVLAYGSFLEPLSVEDPNVVFVGVRNTFKKEIVPSENAFHLDTCKIVDNVDDLALQMSKWSRFSQDGRIPAEKCSELYSLWVCNAAKGQLADCVLVTRNDIGSVTGLLSIQKVGANAIVGLLGVDMVHKREGLGRRLVQAAEDWGYAHGCSYLQVGTYTFNQDACAFYLKMGFELEKVEYFYHFWT